MTKPTGEPVGRPPKFKTPEELEKMIDQYFIDGVRTKLRIVAGKPIEVPMPTITGMVLYLGFCDKSAFYDYEKKPLFSHSIKKARTFIELEYEELMQLGVSTAIFALKNFGWRDTQEIKHDATDKFADAVARAKELAIKYGGASE